MTKRILFVALVLVAALAAAPRRWVPRLLEPARAVLVGDAAYRSPPATLPIDLGTSEPPCANEHPEWRDAQVIEGVAIERSTVCEPDNPYLVAAVVKGTNNVSMETLMKSGLAPDAVVKTNDRDGDGDPDDVHIKLEVVELNGHSPDTPELIPRFPIAPGIEPGFWVFAPKSFGMATRSLEDLRANPLFRVPSPVDPRRAGRPRLRHAREHALPAAHDPFPRRRSSLSFLPRHPRREGRAGRQRRRAGDRRAHGHARATATPTSSRRAMRARNSITATSSRRRTC